jgi:hypothetical protein
MKTNYSFYLICLVFIFTSLGCSRNPQEIKLSDLRTACDYIDAIDQVCDVAIDLKGGKKINDISEEDKKKYEELKSKAIQIAFAGGKKYTGAEFEECPKQKELAEKIKKAFDGLK